MGIFNCVPNGCGRVLYQEYLPNVIRWRYPGEDWQEIEGDDYEIEELPGQCCGTWDITVYYAVPGCNETQAYSGTVVRRIPYGTYRRLEYALDNPFVNTVIQIIYYDCNQNKEKILYVWSSGGKSSIPPNCQDPEAIHDMPGSVYQITDIVRVGGSDEGCTQCFFSVYKKGVIVHTEVREDCPEVEQIPCRLSDVTKEIKIEKIPYLERIEVVPFAYQNVGLNVYQRAIPEESLNIYLNLTTTIHPVGFGIPIPTNSSQNTFNFIAQISSAPGCPPPEYNVICNCDCEKCPDGTCPKECGNYVCCYDTSTGKAVKQIEIEKYCGDEI